LAVGGGGLPKLLMPWKLDGIGFVPQLAQTDDSLRIPRLIVKPIA
jgi:hypothetical protein